MPTQRQDFGTTRAMSDERPKLPADLFEQAIAHCASGLIICDAQRLGLPIVYASPSFEVLSGYSASEAIGKDCLFLQGEETDQIGLDDVQAAIANGIGCKVLLRNYHKSGRPFWNEMTLSPIKSDRGLLTHYVGTQIDISHYLETFKALQESESRYRHLYEETPAMLHSVDADGLIVSASHYWLEKLGYQRHEVIGQPIERFLRSSEETCEEITCRDVPCQFVRKEGDRIDALLSSISERTSKQAPEQSARTLSVSVDVTEQKKVQENLRRNEALMRAINNLPPTGIFVMDAETDEALFVNAEFYRIWRLENLQDSVAQGALSGEQLLSECLSAIDLGDFISHSTSQDFSDGTRIVEDEVPLLDGRTLRRLYGPIQENSVTFAYLYVFEDITERKEAVRQLAMATEAAEAANKAKSEFLANMSHELRSPLNAILGFTHILKASEPRPAQKENLEIIYNSGNHLLALINDILDISKIEAGRIVLNESSFDLSLLLTELQQMFADAAQRKGLSLTLAQADDLPKFVCSDRLKLRQILINLLSNAIKFTNVGSITLTACVQSTEGDKRTLSFAVTDTGEGIAHSDQIRLFEAFVQTKSGLTAQEGTGLGLTISQEYVHLLGGVLQVESTVGAGSTFSFDICVDVTDDECKQAVEHRKIVGLAPNQPQYKVLVVDDVSVNRKLLVHLLSSVGFEVREAVDGGGAIALWQQWKPHLVWMDMQMPVMNGETAARKIRELDAQHETVIIALTASAFEENKISALDSGCDDFLSKPVQALSVFKKMSQHLGAEFQYEEIAQPVSEKNVFVPISSKLLAQTSEAWRYKLAQATLDLDNAAILSLAQQLPNDQKEVYDAVVSCVETLSYKQLLTALEALETSDHEAEAITS